MHIAPQCEHYSLNRWSVKGALPPRSLLFLRTRSHCNPTDLKGALLHCGVGKGSFHTATIDLVLFTPYTSMEPFAHCRYLSKSSHYLKSGLVRVLVCLLQLIGVRRIF